MTKVLEILPQVRQELFYIVNIMGADVLVMQGARISATMIFTMLNRINSVRTHEGLKCNMVKMNLHVNNVH